MGKKWSKAQHRKFMKTLEAKKAARVQVEGMRIRPPVEKKAEFFADVPSPHQHMIEHFETYRQGFVDGFKTGNGAKV